MTPFPGNLPRNFWENYVPRAIRTQIEADNTRAWPKKRLDASKEDENKYDECLACQ